MDNNEILSKWKKEFDDDKKLLKKLSKIIGTNDEKKFFEKLFFDEKKIIARIGVSYGTLNKLTVKLIAHSFAKIMVDNNSDKSKIDILISSDGSPEIKSFLKDIADVFEFEGITSTAFNLYNGYDKKFICRTVKKLELDGSIIIEKNIYNDEVFNVFFIDKNGLNIKKNILETIKLEMDNYNIFSVQSRTAKVQFLSNNKIISDYISKILSLSNRKHDRRKIKIGVSNYNDGVTKILKKILGNMDFNYVINNNINKGNIYKKKTKTPKTYTNFYRKDIAFAMKNKCHILICTTKNGSELILFILNGKQVIYLDSNDITLMFLNFFLTEINTNYNNFSNSYIGTDIPPIQSIKNLINKYNLELFVTENLQIVKNKYLLFYWNQDGQFIFGENKIIEFGFHHLIIKILEMINYYETQRLNIYSQKNILSKMYGDYKTYTLIYNDDLYKFNLWLDNIQNSRTNEWFQIDNVTRFKISNDLHENLIAKIVLKSGVEFFIKFNYINRKIIIYIRLENTITSIWSKKNVAKKYIHKVNYIIKKDLKDFI